MATMFSVYAKLNRIVGSSFATNPNHRHSIRVQLEIVLELLDGRSSLNRHSFVAYLNVSILIELQRLIYCIEPRL